MQKQQLGGGRGKARQGGGFTDHNAKWLKPAKKRQPESESEGEEDEEEGGEPFGSGSEGEEGEDFSGEELSLSGEEFSSDGGCLLGFQGCGC